MSQKDFRIVPFEARTLTWWRARKSKMDMDPPYQRRGQLWSTADKAYLVDSILNGFDIPKIYVADFTWGDSNLNQKKLPYAVIDGKQRFEAIFDFFEGRIVLNKDFVYRESPSLKLGGLGYKDLQENHADIAELFDNYNLSVMSVMAKAEEVINELFVRLNRSKPLTGAEVRNAMVGTARDIISEIARHDFFKINIKFAIKRGADLNAAAKILVFEYFETLRETKKRNLDDFVENTAEKDAVKLEVSGRRVLNTLDDMALIFLPEDQLLRSSGTLPVYYWLIRNQEQKNYPSLREFLVRFEEKRRGNLRLSEKRPGSRYIDQDLLDYDTLNRSTNDQRSHEQRFRILATRFLTYLDEKCLEEKSVT